MEDGVVTTPIIGTITMMTIITIGNSSTTSGRVVPTFGRTTAGEVAFGEMCITQGPTILHQDRIMHEPMAPPLYPSADPVGSRFPVQEGSVVVVATIGTSQEGHISVTRPAH